MKNKYSIKLFGQNQDNLERKHKMLYFFNRRLNALVKILIALLLMLVSFALIPLNSSNQNTKPSITQKRDSQRSINQETEQPLSNSYPIGDIEIVEFKINSELSFFEQGPNTRLLGQTNCKKGKIQLKEYEDWAKLLKLKNKYPYFGPDLRYKIFYSSIVNEDQWYESYNNAYFENFKNDLIIKDNKDKKHELEMYGLDTIKELSKLYQIDSLLGIKRTIKTYDKKIIFDPSEKNENEKEITYQLTEKDELKLLNANIDSLLNINVADLLKKVLNDSVAMINNRKKFTYYMIRNDDKVKKQNLELLNLDKDPAFSKLYLIDSLLEISRDSNGIVSAEIEEKINDIVDHPNNNRFLNFDLDYLMQIYADHVKATFQKVRPIFDCTFVNKGSSNAALISISVHLIAKAMYQSSGDGGSVSEVPEEQIPPENKFNIVLCDVNCVDEYVPFQKGKCLNVAANRSNIFVVKPQRALYFQPNGQLKIQIQFDSPYYAEEMTYALKLVFNFNNGQSVSTGIFSLCPASDRRQ